MDSSLLPWTVNDIACLPNSVGSGTDLFFESWGKIPRDLSGGFINLPSHSTFADHSYKTHEEVIVFWAFNKSCVVLLDNSS